MATLTKEIDANDETAKTVPPAEEKRIAYFMTWAPQVAVAILIAHRYHPILPLRDILFCALYPTYLLLANRYRFASNLLVRQRPTDHQYNVSVLISNFFSEQDESWFKNYMVVATTLGAILPLVAIFHAPAEVAALAAPPLFVLYCQIIGESIVFLNPFVHRFIALLVPVGFQVYRMNLLVEWFIHSVSLYEGSVEGQIPVWYKMGLALSGLNLLFWSYNVFVVLLLRVFPEYLTDAKCESPDTHGVWFSFVRESGEPLPSNESR
mmetsp:Transcript_2855/g.6227  ORF Transcript_2855/g.6227 Transcript_2855/m.6227 type:complete len:265 (+) Transcript_2855:147-941(+)